jgi:acetyl esterase/lipase
MLLPSADSIDVWQCSPYTLRMLFLLAAMYLVAADVLPVRVVNNIPYLTGVQYPNDLDKLDLYLPQGRSGMPVIVWIHGGALTQDDKNLEVATGRRFAQAGIATATVNYRLSPAVSHPAHVQDAAASFAWVKRHIAEYGGDPDRIFLVGHSAGAYLAALLVTDERFLNAQGLSARDVRGVVPISAFFWVEREGVAPDRPKSVWGTDPKVWMDASPSHHLRANLPPTLIIYADGDEPWRRQQNVDMAQAMEAAGSAPVDVVRIADRSHMSIWQKLGQEGDPTAERVIAFVRSIAAR